MAGIPFLSTGLPGPIPSCDDDPPVAPWELRIGSLRVYYEVEEHPDPKVVILAVGVKERNRVRIGKDIVRL